MTGQSVRRDLQELRSAVAADIRSADDQGVEQGLDTYLDLIEEFFDHLSRLSVKYDVDQATREVNQFPSASGWEELEWIRDDFVDLLRVGFEHPRRRIVMELISFPYSVLHRALEAQEMYTLELFWPAATTDTYRLSQSLERELSEQVSSKLARSLDSFSEWGLGVGLDKSTSATRTEFLEAVAERALLQVNALLKHSFEAGREEDFERFHDVLVRFDSGIGWRSVREETRRRRGRRGGRESDARNHISAKKECLETIAKWKRLVQFGLSAWIVKNSRGDGVSPEYAQNCFSLTGRLGNIDTLVTVYAQSLNYRVQDQIGWDRWLLETGTSGVVSVNFSQYLHEAVIVHAAEHLATGGDLELGSLPDDIEQSRLLFQSASEGGGLRQAAEQIPEQEEYWRVFADTSVQGLRNQLLSLCDQIVRQYEAQWEASVTEAAIDQERVDGFAEGILSGHRNGHTVRTIFQDLDRITTREEAGNSDTELWIGYHHLLDKELFVEDANVMLRPLGEQYGRGLAQSEDERVLKQLRVEATSERASDSDSSTRIMENALAKVEDVGSDPIILIVNSFSFYRNLVEDGALQFTSTSDTRLSTGRVGRYKNADVLSIRAGQEGSYLLAFVPEAVGEWIDYRPSVDGEQGGFRLIGDRLKLTLSSISRAEAEALVESRPDSFLDGEEDEDRLSEEEGVEKLLQKVRFQLYSRVGIRTANTEGLVCFSSIDGESS